MAQNHSISAVKKFIFGRVDGPNIYGAQSIGGTSAIRILADVIKEEITDRVSIPNPTWENHENVFGKVGFKIDKYPYPKGMFEHIAKLPKKTVVLLHAVCHNPTGHDLTKEEWQKLEKLMREKELIPFFDNAYQGFGAGYDEDMWAIRYFIEQGQECFVANSFSKTFALYGERIGAAFVIMKDQEVYDKVKRNVRFHIRTNYSSPPRQGAHIVKLILQTPKLFAMWEKEITACRKRMESNRKLFAEKLREKGVDVPLKEIEKGRGFFCLLGLNKEAELRLRNAFGVYTAGLSRVNLTALTKKNIDYVVDSIQSVCK